MDLTVAICTWNRARLLDATLAQMCNLRIPGGLEWELLIVDNNSPDDTPSVVERYVGRLPIRRLFEPKQGLANARNCALQHAAGDLLLYTDDDVLVDEAWIESYVGAVSRWPNAGFFGGLIAPWFEHEPPKWFADNRDHLGWAMAVRDFGPLERPLLPNEEPFGANMGMRRAAFSTATYNPRLGRNRNNQLGGEETIYFRELVAAGFQGVWVPSAKVKHYVVAERLTLEYVRRFSVGLGRTEVRVGADSGKGNPRWVYRALVESHAKIHLAPPHAAPGLVAQSDGCVALVGSMDRAQTGSRCG